MHTGCTGENMTQEKAVQNTDRELWREREGDYYADSIHVTEGGGIGIDCGGRVIVKPVREWHRLALAADAKYQQRAMMIEDLCAQVASLTAKLNKADAKLNEPVVDPMDTPLPCDIHVQGMRFGKGVALRTFVDAAIRWRSGTLGDTVKAMRARVPEQDVKDAARYRWLRDNVNNSLSLSRNDGHASNYMTAAQWIEEYATEHFSDTSSEEIQKMKDTNTIWSLQIYPNTPIGFNVWHASTLDAVIDEAADPKPE